MNKGQPKTIENRYTITENSYIIYVLLNY